MCFPGNAEIHECSGEIGVLKVGSGSGESGFGGLPEGWFGAGDPLEEIIVIDWTQTGVYFQPPGGQKSNSG